MNKEHIITPAIKRAIKKTPCRFGTPEDMGANTPVIARLVFPMKNGGSFLIVGGGYAYKGAWDGDTVSGFREHGDGVYTAELDSLERLLSASKAKRWSFGEIWVQMERDEKVGVNEFTLRDIMGDNLPSCLAPSAAPEVKDAAPQPPEKPAAAPSAPVELASNFDAPQDAQETPQDAPAKRTRKSAKKRTTPRKDAQDAPAAPGKTGTWEPDVWTRLAKSNPVEARAAAAAWAATDATSEKDELMGLVADYLFLAFGNADAEIVDALERDGLDYRGQLDAELAERVRRVYGPEKWEKVAACF